AGTVFQPPPWVLPAESRDNSTAHWLVLSAEGCMQGHCLVRRYFLVRQFQGILCSSHRPSGSQRTRCGNCQTTAQSESNGNWQEEPDRHFSCPYKPQGGFHRHLPFRCRLCP